MTDKAIFLDRDDTLIEDTGYINNRDQVKLLDGVAEALCELKSLGYKLIITTNQSGIARGLLTENDLAKIHDRLKELLAYKGASLDAIYYCPYHPEGTVEKYRKTSDMRKPGPGMLLAAAQQMDIDLSNSWCIGNSDRDIEAGNTAGCRTILLDSTKEKKLTDPVQSRPDYRAVNIKEAVNIIKKHLRSNVNQPVSAQEKNGSYTQSKTQIETELVTYTIPPENPSKINSEQKIEDNNTKQLLTGILEQLRKMQRNEMFEEFSIARVIAGIVQVLVLFCLIIAIFVIMSPTGRHNSVMITLGFAAVLQLITLTLLIQRPKK